MTAIDDLRDDLDAARAELLATLEGITQEEFVRVAPTDDQRPAIRDLLWDAGIAQDWVRRLLSQAVGGRPLDAFAGRRRPDLAGTVPYLLEWLDQTRRPTLALLRRLLDARLPDTRLDEPFTLPEGGPVTGTQSVCTLLAWLAAHDRALALLVRALRAAPAGAER